MRRLQSPGPARLLAIGAALGLLALTSGCGGKSAVEQARLAQCGQRVTGSKYTLCGHWSTTAAAPVSTTGYSVIGSVDAAPRPSNKTYSIQGGTFHAVP